MSLRAGDKVLMLQNIVQSFMVCWCLKKSDFAIYHKKRNLLVFRIWMHTLQHSDPHWSITDIKSFFERIKPQLALQQCRAWLLQTHQQSSCSSWRIGFRAEQSERTPQDAFLVKSMYKLPEEVACLSFCLFLTGRSKSRGGTDRAVSWGSEDGQIWREASVFGTRTSCRIRPWTCGNRWDIHLQAFGMVSNFLKNAS